MRYRNSGSGDGAAPPGQGTVLVVDDSREIREMIVAVLGHAGFQVRATGDGQVALRWLREGGISAVLLDVTMPAPSGPEIYAALRSEGIAVPVVVASGHLESEVRALFGEPGPAAILPKPFHLAELVGTLRRLVPGSSGSTGGEP
jgi:two-component system, NtrC family, nitrogen regulation response regulator GlnG